MPEYDEKIIPAARTAAEDKIGPEQALKVGIWWL